MRSLVKYIQNPRWPRQQWRRAVWQVMANIGLTGLHALPLRKQWVEFALCPMPIQHLPPALDGMTLVQISDLHYSPLVWGKYLDQYIQWINELSPGIVVVTGDLFMGGRRYADKVAALLADLQTTYGVLCILGNHDYGIDANTVTSRGVRRADYLVDTLRAHGLIVLRNSLWRVPADPAGRSLTFVGLDDDWAGEMSPDQAFADVKAREAVICLVHNPAHCLKLMEYPWQWMLCGHTHGRQLASGVIGRRLYPKRYRQFTHGLYTLNGRHLYVNRGLSYGQRARNWCRPEITVFQLARGG